MVHDFEIQEQPNGDLTAFLLDLDNKEKATELLLSMIEKCKAKGDETMVITLTGWGVPF